MTQFKVGDIVQYKDDDDYHAYQILQVLSTGRCDVMFLVDGLYYSRCYHNVDVSGFVLLTEVAASPQTGPLSWVAALDEAWDAIGSSLYSDMAREGAKQAKRCSCDIVNLMGYGCKCGGV